MTQSKVTIVDYGISNLLNVARAFEYAGADVTVTEDPRLVANAERLVLPGVGAFSDSIKEVTDRGFAESLRAFAQTGRPMFGICVGMQMLFEASEEFGEHVGLGILPGHVKPVPCRSQDGKLLRVPHIGWNHLVEPEVGRDWRGSLFESFTGAEPAMYFVHSFAAEPFQASDRLADCIYGGHRICAAVQHDNIVATQFHPEKSGEIGLALIGRFMEM